jgi:hypothetical protein
MESRRLHRLRIIAIDDTDLQTVFGETKGSAMPHACRRFLLRRSASFLARGRPPLAGGYLLKDLIPADKAANLNVQLMQVSTKNN